jgi:recombination protein RecT
MAETTTKALKPIDEVRGTMERMRPQFKKALPPHISPEKFERVVMTAIQNNPKILDANRQSLYGACMKAAADGLIPDGKEAALVQFGQEVAYMPMVSGILKKVRNSGELASITAQIVYKNEIDSGRFDYYVDTEGEHLVHKPIIFADRGEKVGVYALAKMKDGAVYVEVMTAQQVGAVRNVAKTKTIWDGPFGDEKWKVTAIRRLSKRLPMSTDLEQVIHRDDELVDLSKPQEEELAPKPPKKSRLDEIVEAQEVVEPNEDPNIPEDMPL